MKRESEQHEAQGIDELIYVNSRRAAGASARPIDKHKPGLAPAALQALKVLASMHEYTTQT